MRNRLPYRWTAMGIVLVGAFMVVLDITIVNIALPAVRDGFDSDLNVEWVVTSYAVAVGVTQTTSGWIGDRFGRRVAFVGAIAAFTVGSILCAAAPSLELLVVARVIQGVGGGLLIPIAMAMVYELFEPDERGRALGIFGIAVMVAPAAGPILGGILVSSVGWRWVFLINVPIGAVAMPLALRLLRDTGYRETRRFDGRGLVLVGAGLVALLVGLQQGGDWGWGSPETVLALTVAVVSLVAFALHSLRVPQPLVDIRIFANPVFGLSMAAMAAVTLGQFTRLVYVPLELGTTRGTTELTIGLVMMPSAVGMALLMPVGGRLVDRIGSRIPFTVGTAILAVSFVFLAGLSVDTGLVTIATILFVGGIGSGLAMMTPNIVAMNAVTAAQVAQASGLSSATRQVMAGVGTAVMAAIFAARVPDVEDLSDPAVVDRAVSAYNDVFAVVTVVLVAGLVLGLALPGRRRALELQAERRAEAAELRHGLVPE